MWEAVLAELVEESSHWLRNAKRKIRISFFIYLVSIDLFSLRIHVDIYIAKRTEVCGIAC